MSISWNEVSEKSMGGTELMCRKLESSLDKDLLENFQIIPSRVRDLDESKIRILWCHDLPLDPESNHLKDGGWRKFHKIVFVSYWQRDWYVREFQIPFSRTAVLQNAIVPIPAIEKPLDKVNLIYHTTPHRGLDVLYSVVEKLVEKHADIHLDVYSSFKIYGWAERDKEYEALFKKIGDHPNMAYHGFQSNDDIRAALQKAHIFAYPNTWMETSCLSLMEAMSAECACIHPDLGALPETSANWTFMYPFNEDKNQHAMTFYHFLDKTVELVKSKEEGQSLKFKGTKNYCDLFYNWDVRLRQWDGFLRSLLGVPREFEKAEQVFTYRSI